MPIYRGAGGSGDAVADSSSEALLVRELVAAAQLDADAAAASATSASGSASTASTAATNASTSATNAANSATSASTSASNAASSASDAATSEQNALNFADQAFESNTDAENHAASASTSATNAATSASTATTQAGIATTQATNAATSASSSATSADSAAASAAAAAMSYDSFDDRYLGSKSSAPTLDNDGNALVTGALYYNNGTVTPADKGMYVYDGTGWIAASAASTAILTVFKYTATAAQTTFTGADDNSLTLTYTAGSAIITLNGAVLEIGTDVTATSGTSIVLAQSALAGDEVNIYAFATFNIANTYTQAQVDAGFLTKSNPNYTGTLTGGTGVVNLGSGQFYKDASGNIGVGTSSPTQKLDIAGSLALTGTGNRILGDFSNATIANRVAFQTNTTNGPTSVSLLPNGTAQVANFRAFNTADPTNSAFQSIAALSTEARIETGITGTGTYLPLTMFTGGSERLRIDTSGNVGIGTASPSAKLDVNKGSAGVLANFTDGVNTNCQISTTSLVATFGPTAGSTALAFQSSATERMRIDASGGVRVNTTSTLISASETFSVNGTGNAIGVKTSAGTVGWCQLNWNSGTSGNNLFHEFGTDTAYTARGSITYNRGAGLVAYNVTSDYRAKDIISPVLNSGDVIDSVPVYMGKMKGATQERPMFIAHETPSYAHTGEKDAVDKDGNPVYQQMDTSSLVPVLWAEIQSLRKRVAQLEGNN